jgi:uncharacterized protein (TIGR03435 family)
MRHRDPRFTAFTLAAFAAASAFTAAQSTQPPDNLKFEVASVKQSPPVSFTAQIRAIESGVPVPVPVFGVRTRPGGRLSALNRTLKQLVVQAFGVQDYQVSGGPPWSTTDFFVIEASAGREATTAEINAMLQALLRDRFALRTHAETRETPTFVLSLARADGRLGAGLKRTSDECVKEIEARKAAPLPPGVITSSILGPASGLSEPPTTPRCGGTTMVSRGNAGSTLLFGGQEMRSLVSRISSELSAPVIDRTGLDGLFDITLEYTPARQSTGLDPNSSDAPPPPIANALQQQLGLKLEKQTASLPIVVIDSVEHPTPD